ncbi:DUF1631 family protein [Thermomonas aquatica]|uniref:DUF1631 domain-containing protein n=1 Tax=Thermomonas aquatica TaxID=2202149 RepID=A0A5B7ZMX8_9GAMM|nr:DUF1631 family protein [Thermomonas aquatica]QDA55999.1 DUF1631 domain-containing protein [Thermomonas aquatica]
MSLDPPANPFGQGRQDPALLLDALQKVALEKLKPALDAALGRVDDYLFQRSESGHDDFGLNALRDLRRARSQIGQRFEQGLIAGFRALIDPRAGMGGADSGLLALVSEDALEEQLANEQLAASLTRMHAPELEVLGKRIAHLAGRDSLDALDNPMNPAFIAALLRRALEGVDLDAGVRIVVFKFFERELAIALGSSYERGNTLLVSAGVLPQLRATVRAEAPKPAGPGEQAFDSATLPAMSHPPSPAEQAVFANLLGLLQGWRTSQGPALNGHAGQGAVGPAQTLSSNELMSILSLMQRDAQSGFEPARRNPQQSLAEQLRQEVFGGARKLGVQSDNLSLDGLDEDAVDLVAMLFDVLLDGPQYDADIRRKIGRMLVPYVKVAVQDRRMFLFKEHPARKLLNTVAEACEGNHGEAPQERELLGRVDGTIDRLVTEFNEDVAIFETLEQELRSYMAQHRKRFELAEKRATEAQRGRERLEHARSATNALLAQHRGERVLPAVMTEFLSGYTSHHLIQVMLRDGHGSPRYDDAMLAVDELMQAFDHAELRTPVEELPALHRPRFEAILASSGCLGDGAEAAIDCLQDALVRLASGERAADNTTHMPEPQQAPEPVVLHEPEPVLEVVAGTDTLDFDGAVLERMRKLQVGGWIQLATSADRIEPAKVSWISPISGRLLLVNRRGIRVLVASAEELAAMAKLGKVSLREGESPFEDALHQVAGRLQNAANQG